MSEVLAFDDWNKILYEGDDNTLHALYPQPVVSKAIFDPQIHLDVNTGASLEGGDSVLFREDQFDPTTRIRRGRFYGVRSLGDHNEYQPARVQHFPYSEPLGNRPTLRFKVYRAIGLPSPRPDLSRSQVVLGTPPYAVVWRVVYLEQMNNRELLFTLKAQSSFGILPMLDEELVPKDSLVPVRGAVEKVLDAAYTYQPTPIVDVCREATRVVLAAWLAREGEQVDDKDLGEMLKGPFPERVGIQSAATLINRLHPRGKSSETARQAAKGVALRPLVDEDAAMAVDLFGFLLREVGWVVQ